MASSLTMTRRTLAVGGAFALIGCAAKPVLYDRAGGPKFGKLAVLTPGFPDGPTIEVPVAFPAPALYVANRIQHVNRQREFATFMAADHLDASAEFARALAAAMTPHAAALVGVPEAATRSDLLKDYAPVAHAGYDAILDIVISEYGYRATAFTDFTPSIQGEVRLVDARTARVLMQDTIDTQKDLPTVPDVGRYSFDGYGKLSADPKVALRGLREALDASAQRVATLIA